MKAKQKKKENKMRHVSSNDSISSDKSSGYTLSQTVLECVAIFFRKLGQLISQLLIILNENPASRWHRKRKNENMKLNFSVSSLIEHQPHQHGNQPRKLNLVLDLEGTLIRSLNKPWSVGDPGKQVTITYKSGSQQIFYVRKRPYLTEFLRIMSEHFNIFVFTAQIKEYADPLIDILGDDCLDLKYGKYQKELMKITKNLRNTILVDNSRVSIQGDLENSLLIPTYKGDPDDKQLLQYGRFLQIIAKDPRSVKDIQSVIDELKDEFDL